MSQKGRRRLSLTCIVIGALALSLAVPLAYLDRNVFEPQGFADNAAQTLQNDAVRGELSAEITSALVAADPQAVSFVPLIRSVSDTVLKSSQAASLMRRAAVETHNAVFSQTKGSVIIDLANVGVIAFEFLKTQDAKLGRDLSQPQQIALKLSDRSLTLSAVRAAEAVRLLAFVLPLLALALFAAALVIDRHDRRHAALNIGIAMLLVGTLTYAGSLIVRAFVVYGADGSQRDVAAGIYDAFMGSFVLWAGGVALAGAIVAASAASLGGRIEPADIPAFLWGRITREPDRQWKLVVGALALVLVGIWIIGDPIGAVRFVTVAFGSWLIFAGAVTLLRLVIGPEPDDLPRTRAMRRSLIPALVASVVVVIGTATILGSTIDSRARPEPKVNDNPGCNGFVELCDRRLDEVTLAATHNSESSAQALFLNPNHGIDIASQLELGVRGLLIDAYLGQRNDEGTVRTDLAPKAVDAVEAKIGVDGLAAAQRLAGSVAFGPVAGDTELYLCHVLCELGALKAVDVFREIRDWMDRNPREVLMIVIEDAAPTADIKRELEAGGLAELASAVPIRAGLPTPTLRELIDSGRRLLVMAEDKGDATGWYRRAFEVLQETPFAFTSPAQLELESSCRVNRGGTRPPLFLVNHWVESYPPRPRDATIVNEREFILRRARECARIRDRTPTLIAVDFVERGDLIGAVDVLNGVSEGAGGTSSGTPQTP